MSIAKPSATLTLDGETLSAAEAGLVRVRVDMGFNTHDRVQLMLWPQSRLAGASPGSELGIQLSLEADGGGLLAAVPGLGGGASNDLWTGIVHSVHQSAEYTSLEGFANSTQLSDQYRSQSWEDMSIADIVADLAGDLSSEVEADLQLSFYSIDNGRSVWSYLFDLAQLAGADITNASDGGIRFASSSKQSSATELRYGAELLQWRLTQNTPLAVIGAAEHGAASSSGSDKWHWLAHDPVGAGGESVRVPAAFHSRDSASAFSDAAAQRASRAQTRAEVWLGGRPEIRPGHWVELKDLPQGDSGPLRVREVTHQLDGYAGYITALRLEGAGGGAGGLGF